MSRIFYWLAALCAASIAPFATAANQEGFTYSGYARLVGGYSDEPYAKYEGYTNQFSLDEHSLLGLQGEFRFNESLSLTGQVLAHSGEFQSSGIEWLYLTYRPVKNLDIKLGQMRTPFFDYSDVLDVGFAYHWILAPREMYNDFVFKNLKGVDARYQWVGRHVTARLEAYYGNIDEDSQFQGQTVRTEVNDLTGIIGELSFGNWHARLSHHQANVSLDIPQFDALAQVLRASGFNASADSIATDSQPHFVQASLSYEALNYFIRAERSRILVPFDFSPDIKSFYVSAGIRHGELTLHATFAKRVDSNQPPLQEIPVGVAPELDALASAYQLVFDSTPEGDVRSVTVGARWDFRPNTALKFEVKRVMGERGEQSSFSDIRSDKFDSYATVAMAALEVVF